MPANIVAGTRNEAAPAARSEMGRTTEQVKLRLRPEDALRLRYAARERGIEVSAYVAQQLDDPERAAALAQPAVSELPLADVSRFAGVLGLLPEEVRRWRGELGRAFGLLKHFFEMPATSENAERHAFNSVIAKLAPKRRAGRGSFSALKRYFEIDERELARDDLVASWSGLVASHETVALEMEAVAYSYAQRGHEDSRTTADPVYHVIL